MFYIRTTIINCVFIPDSIIITKTPAPKRKPGFITFNPHRPLKNDASKKHEEFFHLFIFAYVFVYLWFVFNPKIAIGCWIVEVRC